DDSLSGVEDFGFRALNGVDELTCHGRRATQALQQVEDHAFTGKDNASVMTDGRDDLSFVKTDAIEDFGMADHLRVSIDAAVERGKNFEDASDGGLAGEDAVLLGADKCEAE